VARVGGGAPWPAVEYFSTRGEGGPEKKGPGDSLWYGWTHRVRHVAERSKEGVDKSTT